MTVEQKEQTVEQKESVITSTHYARFLFITKY